MKLPWDKNYLKISFHVIFTLVVVYALATVVDWVSFIVGDFWHILSSIFISIGSVLRLLTPLIGAFVIAYLLNPVADFYQRKYEKFRDDILIPFLKKNELYIRLSELSITFRGVRIPLARIKDKPKFEKRFAGTILTYISVIGGFAIIVRLLMSSLGIGTGEFSEMMANSAATLVDLFDGAVFALASWGVLDFLEIEASNILSWVQEPLLSMGDWAISAAASAGAAVLNFFISLFVAFYFINDKAKLKYQIKYLADTLLPKKPVIIITNFLEDMHVVFSSYIKGMILDGAILGTLIAIGLSLVGVELAILIGVLTAIFNMIPLFGGIMAFIMAVTFELLMGSPLTALYAAIVILVIQQFDSMYIVPRVVGKRVSLSPPTVIVSLSIAAAIFGVLGMLLIVPSLAIIKIFALRFIERRRGAKPLES